MGDPANIEAALASIKGQLEVLAGSITNSEKNLLAKIDFTDRNQQQIVVLVEEKLGRHGDRLESFDKRLDGMDTKLDQHATDIGELKENSASNEAVNRYRRTVLVVVVFNILSLIVAAIGIIAAFSG